LKNATNILMILLIVSFAVADEVKGSSGKDNHGAINGNHEMILSFPGIGKVYHQVFGEHFAGESFRARENSLQAASIWLAQPNDEDLLIQVLENSITGEVLASASLATGKIGKRTVKFDPPVILKKGGLYYLKVSSGAPGTTTGLVEQQKPNPMLKGFTEDGESRYDMAMELFFQPYSVAASPSPSQQVMSKAEEELRYEKALNQALSQKRDVWGEELIARPEGPTYENIVDLVHPLMFCGDYVTASGVYYLAFGKPAGITGGGDCALHVGDGSEFISRHHKTGRRTIFFVGKEGNERFGQILERLKEPKLLNGYQPVLVSEYTDEQGVFYRQESFAAYVPETKSLVSFIRLAAQPQSDLHKQATFKIKVGDTALSLKDNRLIKGDKTYICFQPGAYYEEPYLIYRMNLRNQEETVVHLVRLNQPEECKGLLPDEKRFSAERDGVTQYWDELLAQGAQFKVPEKLVMNAMRNLLVQNLFMTWRYSLGNQYERWYPRESGDPLSILGEYGFVKRTRENLQVLLPQKFRTENERMMERGVKLFYAARYYFLTADSSFIQKNRPLFSLWMDGFLDKMKDDPHGILGKGRGGDINTGAYYAHDQAQPWRGMRDMAYIYNKLGFTEEARKFAQGAEQLKTAVLKAVNTSKIDMDDGSLFMPCPLLESFAPHDPITATKAGTYWNLRIPTFLRSGIIDPRGKETGRILQYLFNHGSRFLGLTRCNYYPVAIGSYRKGGLPGYRTTGADNVYGVALIETLAEQDRADQIVLSLYGKLAHGMSRGTFIAGEGDSFDADRRYRSFYLPPNSTNNCLFLKIVHDMLIFNHVDEQGVPEELLLAHFTPRGWLEDGKEIRVKEAPTPFGKVSFSIKSHLIQDQIEANIQTPKRQPPRKFILRLRTPGKRKIRKVLLNGKPYNKFNISKETIDISNYTGVLKLMVYYKIER